jgi:DNA (cytosine-5)-methyltransferase 1
MRFVDLFAGLGGFHIALKRLGHECVFASEIDGELCSLYAENFPEAKHKTFGDIRRYRDEVPPHEILCAGFPCQPFSKSGSQLGLNDKEQGTLFDEIVHVLKKRRPPYVILENVGNFERHDKGRTWRIVREKLQALDYDVRGTEHITSGGPGLISPHHFGFPHSRERFFIIAKQGDLPGNPFPPTNRKCKTCLSIIVQPVTELTEQDVLETGLSTSQRDCIEHWNLFLSLLPEEASLPSFPIWGDEIEATYPFEEHTPYQAPIDELRRSLNGHTATASLAREELLQLLPSYARAKESKFPQWKVEFIRSNREWFRKHQEHLPREWTAKLRLFPPSFRKLEWNCQGEERDLWKHVLQLRPSGLRVKRYSSSPSLVAMTSTQIPILGPEQRFLTRIEGLRLQGFPDYHKLPQSRVKAFRALGNAVHVGVVEIIARQLFGAVES